MHRKKLFPPTLALAAAVPLACLTGATAVVMVRASEPIFATGSNVPATTVAIAALTPEQDSGYFSSGVLGLPPALPSEGDGGVAGMPACGDQTLTQSATPGVIESGASVACLFGSANREYSLARSFTVDAQGLTVGCVTFGVEFNVGPAWPVKVRLRTGGPITGPYAGLTLLAETTVQVPADSGSAFYVAEFPNGVTFAAASNLIVEIYSASRVVAEGGDGGRVIFGCNSNGQTAPTYAYGPLCGVPNFVDTASIGAADSHLALTVHSAVSSCGSGGSCFEPHATPGCSDSACCETICAFDPFCCEVAWDAACADLAGRFCDPFPICPNLVFGVPEPEPCGSSVNGGCPNDPMGEVECGIPICGTFWWDDSLRDVDTYAFTLTTCTCVTWTIDADATVPVMYGLVRVLSGTGGCQAIFIDPHSFTAQHTECLPPGNYAVVVAPSFAGPTIDCGTVESQYVATLSCEPCALPTECCPNAQLVLQLRSGQSNGRSGAPGDPDDDVKAFALGAVTDCDTTSFISPFTSMTILSGYFSSACGSPPATIIAPFFPGALPVLSCDEDARWINSHANVAGQGSPGKSVLYCHPFTVNTAQLPGETCVHICYSVDDLLGDPSWTPDVEGVYVRNAFGVITPLPFLVGGGFGVELKNQVVGGLGVSKGLNHLMIYQHNTIGGCAASGIIYRVQIEICNEFPQPPGDVNGDGLVDGSDLAIVLGGWNPSSSCIGCAADISGDGFVDGQDLAIVLGGWSP